LYCHAPGTFTQDICTAEAWIDRSTGGGPPRPGLRRDNDAAHGAAERIRRQRPAIADIAQRLYLSESTVRNYLSSAIGKTGSRNRIEAVQAARANGWLSPGEKWRCHRDGR
jgi:hypothetical protein